MTTSENANSGVPEQLARIGVLMSSFPSEWCLCGGWAVDSWLGRVTREHGDLDIAVFEDAEPALFSHMAGWQMVPHDGALAGSDVNEQWNGRKLHQPAHLHCRSPEDAGEIPDRGALEAGVGWGLEIVINARNGGEWVLHAEPRVALPLEACVASSPWGLPAALPQVLLFFKATAYKGTRHYLRRRDHVDFERLSPRLGPEARAWLIEAISAVDREHPWLGVLALRA